MGLEAPLALLGLLAATLPWLAHRVRQKDMPVVRLPTVDFLLRAQASRRRRHNLTDLLLLCCRVALLAALSMALTAPYVTARVSFGDGEVSSAAIVIDDSMSMQREYAGSTLLSRAIDRAENAIAALPEGSEVVVVLAGTPARVWLERTKDLRLSKARLHELPPESHRGTDLKGAVELSLRKLAATASARKRMLVLSDFAEHARFDPGEIRTKGTEVVYESVAPAPSGPNLQIMSVSAAPSTAGDGAHSLAVGVRVFGEAPDTVPLRVTGPGDVSQRELVYLEGDQGRAMIQVTAPKAGGDPRIRLELEVDDALSTDNRRDVLLDDEVAVRVLLVNGDPHPADVRDELHYLARALSLAPPDVMRTRISSVDASLLEHYDLAQADVVVLANVAAPPEAYVARLRRFVERGGGLVLAMGSNVQPASYNQAFEELIGAHFTGLERLSPIAFQKDVDPGLLTDGLTGLRHAQTHRRARLDARGDVRLRFEDGTPAVVTHEVGRGRTVLLTTTLDADWSDACLRPGFLPLTAGLVRFAAGDKADMSAPEHAGAVARLPVPAGATLVEVVGPDDVRHRFDDLDGALLSFSETHLSGAYRVLVAGDRAAPRFSPELSFTVPPPTDEGDLAAADQQTRKTDGHGESTVGATLIRKPLARWCLLLAAIFGVAEAALRSFQARRRAS